MKKIINIGIVLALVACASGYHNVNSRVQTSEIPTFQRMLIKLNLNENRNSFNQSLSEGLQKSIISKLATCGIVAITYVDDPLDSKPIETFSKKIKEFQPDSILYIVRKTGFIRSNDGGSLAEFDFNLKLNRLKPTRLEVWTATSQSSILIQNLLTSDTKSGENLGIKLFEIMSKDGVVCRP